MFKKLFGTRLGYQFTDEEIDIHKRQFFKAMKMMEKILEKHKFLCGDEMTIADLSAACELHNVKFIELDYSKFKHVTRWMSAM